MNCLQIKTISIPDSVIYLGASAFENCSNLKTVHLPKDLKEIRSYTFYKCTKLQTINLEEGCSIGEDAFKGTRITVLSIQDTDEDIEFLYKMGKMCLVGDRITEDKNKV